jgi:hypothetical protein
MGRKSDARDKRPRSLAFTLNRRGAAPALAAIALLAPAVSHSQQGGGVVVITMRYTLVENQISPKSGAVATAWTREYRLSGDNVLDHTITMNGKVLETGQSGLGRTGAGVSPVNGLVYRTHAGVVGGALSMTEETETFHVTTTIRTDGKSTCSASRVYRLNPGQTQFHVATVNGHVPEVDTDIHVENMTCSISTAP